MLNLNQFIEEQFNTTPYQTLAGVSLKKIKSSANIAKVNTNPINERYKDIEFNVYISS